MKKTLIALAAVAVAGAASAQTVTGSFTYGYKSSNAGSGFGFDSAKIAVSTTEDLGGGLKLAGSLAVDNVQEDGVGSNLTGNPTQNFVNSKGATLTLTGAFGKLDMTSVEGGDAVALDGLLALGNGTKGVVTQYTTPSMNGFTAKVGHKSVGGFGVGDAGANTAFNIYGADYANGPLSAGYTFLDWNDTPSGANSAKSRSVVTVAYDFGIAKVGVFNATQKYNNANSLKNSALQISAPISSALTVAAEMGSSKVDGSNSLTGSQVKAVYSLSKRTNLTVSHESVETTGKDARESILVINHSF